MQVRKCIIFVVLVCCVWSVESGRKSKRKNRLRWKNWSFDDTKPTRQCGYEGCPKPKAGMLNVHIVPHTHDDVGWLKTVDQYYYGSKSRIQTAGVQYILDSVIQQLLSDPEKRFIYVESAFFFKWWKEQTDALKESVKILVNEGRLEFIGGAWVMNDEATVHYQSTIDQFTWGLRQLNDTFGACGRPKVGWQIDPFGHSREMASLFAQMGYDGLFFGRLDYQDKAKRLATKSAEMIWHGSDNLGDKSHLFTGALYNNYGPPPGFCFDILCSDEPIIDAKWSPDNNVEQRVNDFIKYVNEMAIHYRSNNIVMTMGEDFNYQDANMWYKNLDKLILYVNQRQKNGSTINLFYSTPSCYLKSLHDSNLSWPTKQDDFMPYASDPNAFWSGYFTSRPTIKRFERIGNQFLQVVKQLTALAPEKVSYFEHHLAFFRETMGIMQHHDAITGTEKQHVADDYARRLSVAFWACGLNAREVLNQLTIGKNSVARHAGDSKEPKKYDFNFDSCLSLNISQCTVTEESRNFIVTVYNPLAHSTYQYIRVPVPSAHYTITDYRGVPTESQIVPVPLSVSNLQFRQSNSTYELVFLANELPPIGYKSYFVQQKNDPEVMQADQPIALHHTNIRRNDKIEIGNKYINLSFSESGQLTGVHSNGAFSPLRQEFFYYEGAQGNNAEFKNRSSGAYIFRPNSTEKFISQSAVIRVVKGPIVEEIHQTFNDWLSQVIRIYKDANYAEFEWMVGAIPIDNGLGKEVVTRFHTDLATNGAFYTDSNGREMLRRVRNHRDTWDITLEEPVAGNYYPVTSKIAIEDAERRLAIMNDRAQGGSSLLDGTIDLMIHRRLLNDDAFGVAEALNETAYGHGLVVRGQHYLTFGSKTKSNPAIQAQERYVQLKKMMSSWTFFSDATQFTYSDWQKTYNNIYSAMSLSLPQHVNLLTFEPWKDNTILIRFEHILERDEDPTAYSKPVTINLRDSFAGLNIVEIRETTLAANQWIEDAERFSFMEETTSIENSEENKVASNHSHDDEIRNGNIKMIINLDPNGSQAAQQNHHSRFQRSGNNYDYLNFRNKGDQPQPRQNGESIDDPFVVTLQPMQIRTFVLTLDHDQCE